MPVWPLSMEEPTKRWRSTRPLRDPGTSSISARSAFCAPHQVVLLGGHSVAEDGARTRETSLRDLGRGLFLDLLDTLQRSEVPERSSPS